ncbi:hypothetical protein HK105_201310 [Polyrhizophydium stewartii]|uniref:Transmembrane protein 223 n=1 Tax=Polyrhizophydium stewartii TaxID=2732419 RepID=A0ABR4NHN4_9FUNG|nr:hypothetical protein HK105_006087 [Polyrhizophydium stewartii]
MLIHRFARAASSAATRWSQRARVTTGPAIRRKPVHVEPSETAKVEEQLARAPAARAAARPAQPPPQRPGPKGAVWLPPDLTNDVLVYENTNRLHIRIAYLAAGVQIFMWISIAELALSHMSESDTDASGVTTTKKASPAKRWLTAAACAGVSLIFPGMVQYYARRYVRSIRLVKSGRMVAIENSALMGRRLHVFRTADIEAKGRVDGSVNELFSRKSGKPDQLLLKPAPWRTAFILDKQGRFPDPKLFDYLFAK